MNNKRGVRIKPVHRQTFLLLKKNLKVSTNVEGLKLAGQGLINQKRGVFSDFSLEKVQ